MLFTPGCCCVQDRLSATYSVADWATGYPDLKWDAFKAPQEIDTFVRRFGLNGVVNPSANLDAPAYSHASGFFDGVAKALKAMKGHIKVELLKGEFVQTMSKMRFQADDSRPAEFPRLFTRAWLSNIPCVTGISWSIYF